MVELTPEEDVDPRLLAIADLKRSVTPEQWAVFCDYVFMEREQVDVLLDNLSATSPAEVRLTVANHQAPSLQPPPLADRVRDKIQEIQAARRSTYGLPLAAIRSDNLPDQLALWCDNGFAGLGQVAVFTGEFPTAQAQGICGLVNSAAGAAALLAEQAQRILTLQAALEPFAEYGRWAVTSEGWGAGSPGERLCDWFGPSDFYGAAQAVPGEETSSD